MNNRQKVVFFSNRIKNISCSLDLNEITLLTEDYKDIGWHVKRLISCCNEVQN